MRKIRKVLVFAMFTGWAGAASASILTFDFTPTDFTCEGNGCIPNEYGARVSGLVDVVTGYEYGMGNGFTPNISVEYQVLGVALPASLWATDYAELINALGNFSFDVPFEIIFTADPGYRVRLNSFDIAGWDAVDYQTQFAIYDDNGTLASPNLYESDMLVPGLNSISPLGASLLADGPLHLFISNIGSTGIDNINFDQVAAVPLPAAAWLFGSALVGLVALKRKKA